MQEPGSEAAAILIRHSGFRPLRGHGALLSHDGFPPSFRLLGRQYLDDLSNDVHFNFFQAIDAIDNQDDPQVN